MNSTPSLLNDSEAMLPGPSKLSLPSPLKTRATANVVLLTSLLFEGIPWYAALHGSYNIFNLGICKHLCRSPKSTWIISSFTFNDNNTTPLVHFRPFHGYSRHSRPLEWSPIFHGHPTFKEPHFWIVAVTTAILHRSQKF